MNAVVIMVTAGIFVIGVIAGLSVIVSMSSRRWERAFRTTSPAPLTTDPAGDGARSLTALHVSRRGAGEPAGRYRDTPG